MSTKNFIFNRNLLDKHLKNVQLDRIPNIQSIESIIHKWKHSVESKDLDKTKEISVQGTFLENFFVEILGYKNKIGNDEWTLVQEQATLADSTTPDGILGYFKTNSNDIRAVIELKDAKTSLDKKQQSRTNKLTPIEQAFAYAPKSGKNCKWVIVSNFKEIRLYHSSNALEYEQFFISNLVNEQELKRFYFLLHASNLISKNNQSIIEELYSKNEEKQENITSIFYSDYKNLRQKLYQHLKKHNEDRDEIVLLEKTQKILDRFIFICFCEDSLLIPENTFQKVVQSAQSSFDLSETKIWNQLKGLFHSIDKGNPPLNINRFNGGLFKTDAELDSLIIKDDIFGDFEDIAKNNFSSELDVNILGHIFEQSISDIEEMKSVINKDKFGKQKGKRKRDGIFYTPDYVTKYIIEKTIGSWLEEQKKRLGEGRLPEIPIEKKKMNPSEKTNRTKALNRHIKFWEEYRTALSNIKVLDYACGSGAFLNQAFDYLYKEGQRVNRILVDLKGGQFTLFDLDKHILKHNLFGVDLNKESVEITKLSLWLKTANKHDPLTSLDENILCGNSLIDDEAYAGQNAFDWEKSFPEIMNNGGFDIIIGNPPYGAELTKHEKEYIDKKYETQQRNYDTYTLFMELAIKLVKQEGYIGLITPNTYLVVENGDKLRTFIYEKTEIKELVEIFKVFPDAVVEPIISILKVKKQRKRYKLESILIPRNIDRQFDFFSQGKRVEFTSDELYKRENLIFHYRETEIEKKLMNKITKNSTELRKIADTWTGVKPYCKGKGIPKQTAEIVQEKPYTSFVKEDDSWVKLIRGTEVNRYYLKWSGEYIKYGPWLAEPRIPEIFSEKKLFIRRTDDNLMAMYDDTGMVGVNSVHSIQLKPETQHIGLKYLLALINSRLVNWVFRHQNFHMVGKPFAEVKVIYVDRLPIIIDTNTTPYVDLVNDIIKENQEIDNQIDKFLKFLTQIYKPKQISNKLRTFHQLEFSEFVKELKKQKVKLTDTQKFELMELFDKQKDMITASLKKVVELEEKLNKMVYKLYKLTPEEIELIEQSVSEQ